MRRATEMAARLVYLVPYVAFVVVILTPVAAVTYCAAAVARTVWSNAIQGWRDHK